MSIAVATQPSRHSQVARLSVVNQEESHCGSCMLGGMCFPDVMTRSSSQSADQDMRNIIQLKPVLQRKNFLFRQGESFERIFIVRAGAFKTSIINEVGEEYITGFYLPGDVIGLDSMSANRYVSTATALEVSSVCAVPFSDLEVLATRIPQIQHNLFRRMAQQIQFDQQMMLLLSQKNAEQRVAALLLQISDNMSRRRLSASEFRLPMSRNDMANYLGLTVETVCRVIARFQERNLFAVEGRMIKAADLDGLRRTLSAGRDAARA